MRAEPVPEKRERFEPELMEGYQARAAEARAINAEREAVTLESWPEDGE